jgi:hypothetical protein
MDIEDTNQFIVDFWKVGFISTRTLTEIFGIDFDIEVERVRKEQEYQKGMGIALPNFYSFENNVSIIDGLPIVF